MRMMAYESNNEQLEQVADYDKISNFKDKNNISSWAKGAVEIMLETGLMVGVGDQGFNPRGNATKEQIMVILYRYIQNKQVILDKYNQMVYESPENNNNGYITKGMAAEQVQQILGEGNYKTYPDDGYVKKYFSKADGSIIYLQRQTDGYKVVGWENNGFLAVKTTRKDPSAAPFTVSSSREDVSKVMGTPQSIEVSLYFDGLRSIVNEKWTYKLLGKEKCEVIFNFDEVVEWQNNTTEDLKVFMGNKDNTSEGFAIGDTLEDVIRAMGTPSYYYDYGKDYEVLINFYKHDPYIFMRYGDSKIEINKDLEVISWENRGNLKLRPIKTESQSTYLEYGSTLGDVYKIMGMPNRFITNSNGQVQLYYGSSYLRLGSSNIDSKLFLWENNGNLIFNLVSGDLNAPALKIGSTYEEVIKAQGTPTDFYSTSHISYGNSEVYFNDNKLVRALNMNQVNQELYTLKLSEYWKNPTHETFFVGSSLNDVTRSLGNPHEISLVNGKDKMYRYGNTEFYFDSNNILRTYLYGNSDVYFSEISIGNIKEGSAPVSIGMSKQGVVNAMGTPLYLIIRDFAYASSLMVSPYDELWVYEGKRIFFNNEGIVAEIK